MSMRLVLAFYALSLAGCGGGQNGTVVQGKVTYDGKPVTGGLINFYATGARPLGGPLESDGSFEFELPPGEYKVRVDAPASLPEGWREGDPLPKLGPRGAPEKYADYNTSGLTATVTAENSEQTIDFNLD